MRWLRSSVGLSCVVLVAACGGGQVKPASSRAAVGSPAPPPAVAEPVQPPIDAAATAPPARTRSSVNIRGVHGTLNHDDVNQAMEARNGALTECIQQGRSRVRWVSGGIRFAFKVDAEGNPTEVRVIESDIGHRELELCLTQVLAQTRFPAPAGRTLTRDFNWSMNVDPAYREPEPMDATALDKLLQKKARDVYKECKLRRARNSFQITAYVNPKGRITSLGAVHTRGREVVELDCVLEQVVAWRLPRPRRRSKVSFLLK